MIPLAGETGQQYYAMQNGRYLYDGGFMTQPIETLTGAQVFNQVRQLYYKTQQKDFKLSSLSDLETQLMMVVDNG